MKTWLQSVLASAGYYMSRDGAQRNDLHRIANELSSIQKGDAWQSALLSTQLQLAISEEERQVRGAVTTTTPENLMLRGWKAFSQADEDGIIDAIFRTVGGNKTFIEIGCGNGLENNSHLLVLNGWKGVWVYGSEPNVAHIDAALGGLRFPQLLVERQFVDLVSIGPALKRYCTFLGTMTSIFFPSTSTATIFICSYARWNISRHGSSVSNTTRNFRLLQPSPFDTILRMSGPAMTITVPP